ncbi:MAG TPA: hypothetical protein VEP90_26440 [Methylomirabilota bacterium]|nr:hypothetical protein [Methylomirabilota bacterium]
MSSVKDLIASIKVQINKTPQQLAQELIHPSGFEYGFRHDNGAFSLIRDDKVIEHNAGNGTSLVVDGPGQTVGVKATGITLDSNTVQFKVPKGGLFFGYQPLNPFWLTDNPIDFISPFIKAPLYSKVPVSPIPGGPGPLDLIFVSPTPTLVVLSSPLGGPGVATGLIPLSTYLSAQPLFGINQQLLTMARNIGEVIRNLTSIGA